MPRPKKVKKETTIVKRKPNLKRGTFTTEAPTKVISSVNDEMEATFAIHKCCDQSDVSKHFINNPTLNFLEKVFLTKYVRHFNGARAIREAGYNVERKKLNNISHTIRTRKHVKKALHEYMEATANNDMELLKGWREELKAVAFGNLDDICSWDEEGKVTVIPSDELEDSAKVLPEEITINESFQEGELSSRRTNIKKVSKLQALKLLGASYGWLGNNPVDVDKGRSGVGHGTRAQLARELADSLEAFERTGKLEDPR